ncbi:MAG: phage holin family protein [Candidatus Jorgensenbacteria bacterium]|nr:phage holin family protein [Candidatus Jorgensenbacteria bacterium]
MGFVGRIIFSIASNMVALFAASSFIEGFTVTNGFLPLALAGAILAVLNFFFRPLLKLFFGPLMILTLGLFSVVVNGLLLYVLDIATPHVTIQGYLALLVGALVVSAVNVVLHMSAKKLGSR